MGVTFDFTMDSPEKILARRGLDENGRAQTVLDSEVLRYSEPYVPFKTGMLARSGIIGTRLGSGEVVYNAPYAKKQYYFGRTAKGLVYSRSGKTPKGSSLRGRYWIERMKADHLEDLRKVVVKFI